MAPIKKGAPKPICTPNMAKNSTHVKVGLYCPSCCTQLTSVVETGFTFCDNNPICDYEVIQDSKYPPLTYLQATNRMIDAARAEVGNLKEQLAKKEKLITHLNELVKLHEKNSGKVLCPICKKDPCDCAIPKCKVVNAGYSGIHHRSNRNSSTTGDEDGK